MGSIYNFSSIVKLGGLCIEMTDKDNSLGSAQSELNLEPSTIIASIAK